MKHFEELIKFSDLLPKMYLSYYDKKWNWVNIEVRRSKMNDLMLIVPFNKQGLSQVRNMAHFYMRLALI